MTRAVLNRENLFDLNHIFCWDHFLAEYFERRRFLPSPISRREEKHLGGNWHHEDETRKKTKKSFHLIQRKEIWKAGEGDLNRCWTNKQLMFFA